MNASIPQLNPLILALTALEIESLLRQSVAGEVVSTPDAEQFAAMRARLTEVVALAMRSSDPAEAGSYAQAYLAAKFAETAELLYGRKCRPLLPILNTVPPTNGYFVPAGESTAGTNQSPLSPLAVLTTVPERKGQQ